MPCPLPYESFWSFGGKPMRQRRPRHGSDDYAGLFVAVI
jgi:hypothetical protein